VKVKLGDLTKIKTGKLDANASSEDGQYPFFTCSREPLKISNYSYDCECVLVAGNGDLNVKYYNGKFDAYQRTYIIEDNSGGQLYMPYLYYFMEGYIKELRRQAIGGVIKYIKLGNLTDALIELPSVDAQKKIVNILKKAKQLLSLSNNEILKLDELVNARFVEMFGDPATNPMRWSETTIGDECFYIKDGPHKSLPDIGKENGGHPFISVRNIVNGYIDFSTARYISDEDYANAIKKCHPEKGDMLYSKGGTTGIAKLIDIDEEFANWVHVAVLKFDKSKLNGIFFENMLNGDYCFEQSQRLTKGIANRDLVLSAMAQIKMYRPPMEIQKQFADFVNQVDKSKVAIQKALDKTQMLFDSLMQEYFG
jgi:type I restriction enzyme S subunit